MRVYALVVSNNGPKFKDSHGSDRNISQLKGRPDLAGNGARPRVSITRRGRLTTQGSSMPGLASQYSSILGRTVLDIFFLDLH